MSRTYWMSPEGVVHDLDTQTHVDWIVAAIEKGILDYLDYVQVDLEEGEWEDWLLQLREDQQEMEEIGYGMLQDGWIRVTDNRGKGEIGFQGTLDTFRKNEAEVEKLARESRARNIYVDIDREEEGMESVALDAEDLSEGFIKAINRERRMARLSAGRRPNVRRYQRRA